MDSAVSPKYEHLSKWSRFTRNIQWLFPSSSAECTSPQTSHFPIFNCKIKPLKKGKWTRRPLQILNILSKTNLSKNHNSISFSGRVHLPTVPHLQRSLVFSLSSQLTNTRSVIRHWLSQFRNPLQL